MLVYVLLSGTILTCVMQHGAPCTTDLCGLGHPDTGPIVGTVLIDVRHEQ